MQISRSTKYISYVRLKLSEKHNFGEVCLENVLKKKIIGGVFFACCSPVFAQSSVTLSGIIDEGFGFTNNAAGERAWQAQSGWVSGDRVILQGKEDLGGGLHTIFTLENGFDLNTGKLGQSGRMFGRQAFVGLDSGKFGTITFGRQYDSIEDYLSPLTANGGYAGLAFQHPYDNDNTGGDYVENNSIKFASVNYGGFRFGGQYALSNQAGGFANNREYSAGVSYSGAAVSIAAVYLEANSPGANLTGAVASDYTNFVAKRQRVWGIGTTYTVEAATFGLNYTRTMLDSPVSSEFTGSFPVLPQSLRFDNFEAFAKYQFRPDLWAIGAYTFTEARFESDSGLSKPKWNQGGLMVDYLLSKRTDIYAQVVYQHVTGGSTGTVLDDADILGSAGPSLGNSQLLARVGFRHTF